MTTPDTDVHTESATLADLDRLVELWVELASDQHAYDSHLAAEPNRTPAREALASRVVTGGVRVVRDGDIVGFVMFGLEHGSYEQTVTRGVVHNLFVVPGARGRGIGSALLATAESALADEGADVVALEAMAENEDARRFYERNGYRPHRVELEKPARSDTHSREDG